MYIYIYIFAVPVDLSISFWRFNPFKQLNYEMRHVWRLRFESPRNWTICISEDEKLFWCFFKCQLAFSEIDTSVWVVLHWNRNATVQQSFVSLLRPMRVRTFYDGTLITTVSYWTSILGLYYLFLNFIAEINRIYFRLLISFGINKTQEMFISYLLLSTELLIS